MSKSVAEKIVIRKDDFIKSKPWHADVHMSDGKVMKSWAYHFKTKKSLLKYIAEFPPTKNLKIEDE